jgi:hypothetical protein
LAQRDIGGRDRQGVERAVFEKAVDERRHSEVVVRVSAIATSTPANCSRARRARSRASLCANSSAWRSALDDAAPISPLRTGWRLRLDGPKHGSG